MSSNDITPLPPYLQPQPAPDLRDSIRESAEQAEWDARIAERKAQAMKAEQTLKDSQKGVQELRQESQRTVQ